MSTVSVTTGKGWPDSVYLRPRDYCEGHKGSYVIFVLKMAGWNLDVNDNMKETEARETSQRRPLMIN